MMLVLGANPISGYNALIVGAFDGSYALGSTAVQAAPLLLVAVGICVAFRANVFNIGGEGQLAMGGLASSATALALPHLPSIVLIPLVLLAGAAGGAVWGAIPGAFKAYFNVNEILSTIMLNLVAVQVMNWLLAGPMVDKSQNSTYGLIPETKLLPRASWLPIIVPNTQLHLGVLIAVLVAVGVWVLLVPHELRVPSPGGRAVARRLALRRDAGQADDDARHDHQRGDVRARGGPARLRQHLPPDGDRRQPHRVHRLGRVQRHRRRPLRGPQPALVDRLGLPLRRDDRRRDCPCRSPQACPRTW